MKSQGSMGAYVSCSMPNELMDGRSDLAFSALVAARLLLAFAPLTDVLKNNHQLSSPLTSYPRCAAVRS